MTNDIYDSTGKNYFDLDLKEWKVINTNISKNYFIMEVVK